MYPQQSYSGKTYRSSGKNVGGLSLEKLNKYRIREGKSMALHQLEGQRSYLSAKENSVAIP